MKKNVIYALFTIGIILGPMYSVYLYSQYSDAYVKYDNKYYQATSNSNLLLEKNNFNGTITNNAVDIVNHSVFALFWPTESLFSNESSYVLLENNLSANFDKILSSKEVKIPQLSAKFGSYSRIFFDGSRFWAFRNPPNQFNSTFQIYFFSFNKNGTILSNNTAIIHHNAGFNSGTLLYFLGFFNNYFFVNDLDNSSLLIFSTSNLNESFTISFSKSFTDNYFPSNLDHHGLLWFHTYSDTRFIAFSAQGFLDSRFSPIQKVIKVPSKILVPPFDNLTFNGIDAGIPYLSSMFVTTNHIFSVQLASGFDTFPVIEGIYINSVSKVVLPTLDIFVSFLGYLLCISELFGIINMKYLSKKSSDY